MADDNDGFYVYAKFRSTGADKVLGELKKVSSLITNINKRKTKVQIDVNDSSLDKLADRIQKKLDSKTFTVKINGDLSGFDIGEGTARRRAKTKDPMDLVSTPFNGWTGRPTDDKYWQWWNPQFLDDNSEPYRVLKQLPKPTRFSAFEDVDFKEGFFGKFSGTPIDWNEVFDTDIASNIAPNKSMALMALSGLSPLGKALGAYVAFKTIKELAKMIEKLAKYGSAIALGAESIGATTESLTQLSAAGLSVGTMQGLQTKLTAGMFGEFDTSLAKYASYLGLSYPDLIGMGADNASKAIIENAVSVVDSGQYTEKEARFIVDKLLGSEGTSVFDKFRLFGLSTFEDYIEMVGGITTIPQTIAETNAEFKENLDIFKENMKAFGTSFAEWTGIPDMLSSAFSTANLYITTFTDKLNETGSFWKAIGAVLKLNRDEKTEETETVIMYDPSKAEDIASRGQVASEILAKYGMTVEDVKNNANFNISVNVTGSNSPQETANAVVDALTEPRLRMGMVQGGYY